MWEATAKPLRLTSAPQRSFVTNTSNIPCKVNHINTISATVPNWKWKSFSICPTNLSILYQANTPAIKTSYVITHQRCIKHHKSFVYNLVTHLPEIFNKTPLHFLFRYASQRAAQDGADIAYVKLAHHRWPVWHIAAWGPRQPACSLVYVTAL